MKDKTGFVMPVGSIIPYGGSTAPTGWLMCDGAEVSRTTYADLFAIFSTTYGNGDGSTTFDLPDCRQKFVLAKAASGTGSTLGGTGGEIDHDHSSPAHYHGMGTGANLNITSSGSHTHSADHDHPSKSSGSSGSHDHSLDHNHPSKTSGSVGTHTHSMTHNHGSFTSGSGGSHSHNADTWPHAGWQNYLGTSGTQRWALGPQDGSVAVDGDRITRSTNSTGSHTHSVNPPNYSANTGGGGSHSHSVDLDNFTGDTGTASSHTHSLDLDNMAVTSGSTSHTHGSGDFSGSIGLVTGGVDGNSTMTTGTQNPPFIALNYIIKY